jgi:hypothetical protein
VNPDPSHCQQEPQPNYLCWLKVRLRHSPPHVLVPQPPLNRWEW